MKNKILFLLSIPIIGFITTVLVYAHGLDSILVPLERESDTPKRLGVCAKTQTVHFIEKESGYEGVEEVTEEKTVPYETYKVTLSDFLNELHVFFKNKFELRGDLKLIPLRHWKTLSVNSLDYRIEFLDYPSDGLKSNFNILFKVTVNNEEVGSWSLPMRCELWQDIYMATERLRRGTEVDVNSLMSKRVDILNLDQPPILANVDVSDYLMAMTLAPGKPLQWHHIRPKPDMRKGKVVDIIAQEGVMRITTKGKALEDGLVSEFIAIRNLQSKREVQGQVIDENTVQVYF